MSAKGRHGSRGTEWLARLDETLVQLVAEATVWAVERSRSNVRALLRRLLDEAAVALPAALRDRIQACALAPSTSMAATVEGKSLLLEAAEILAREVEERRRRLGDVISRQGALAEPERLDVALQALVADSQRLHTVQYLVEWRRALAVAEAQLEREASALRERFGENRDAMVAIAGEQSVVAAETSLHEGDLLPAHVLLQRIPRGARSTGAQPSLSGETTRLQALLESQGSLLSPEEIQLVRDARSPASLPIMERGSALHDSWKAALASIEHSLEEIARERERRMHEIPTKHDDGGSAGRDFDTFRRVAQSVLTGHSARVGLLSADRWVAREAAWELARAAWSDGPLATLSAALEARVALREGHAMVALPDRGTAAQAARSIRRGAILLSLEAHWRRRASIRRGDCPSEDLDRERSRLGEAGEALPILEGQQLAIQLTRLEAETRVRFALAHPGDARLEADSPRDLSARVRVEKEGSEP